MAGQTFSWIADKFLVRQQQNHIDLGRLRAARKFDRNNYENAINNVTGRTTTDRSKRLAIAQGLGLATQSLIIGGQRDGNLPGVRPSAAGLPGVTPPGVNQRRPSAAGLPGVTPPGVRPKKKSGGRSGNGIPIPD